MLHRETVTCPRRSRKRLHTGGMEPRVWVNPRQPQTLYIAHLLMYFQGGISLVFWMIGGLGIGTLFGSRALAAAYLLLIVVGKLIAAFGIANEMRWGYKLGVAAAAAPLVIRVLRTVAGSVGALLRNPIDLLFDIALLALLLHPISRGYRRYWRKKQRR